LKKIIKGFLAPLIALFIGCAGNAPNPIQVIQNNDYSYSCNQLTSEVNSIARFTSELSGDDTSKWKRNIALSAAGSILIVPYFFMDLTEGHGVEVNAARARYIHLYRLAVNKNCNGFDQNTEPQNLESSLRKLDILYENGTISKQEFLQKRNLIISESEL